MGKKKMRAFAAAMAVVLAFIPFLGGCAGDGAALGSPSRQGPPACAPARVF